MKEKYTIIDNVTGEVINSSDYKIEPIQYTTAIEDYTKKKEIVERTNRLNNSKLETKDKYGSFSQMKYLKSCILPLKEIGISNANITRVVYLSTYINYDNALMTDNHRPMDKHLIKIIMNLSKNTFDRFFKEITEKEVLIKKDEKYYLSKKNILIVAK